MTHRPRVLASTLLALAVIVPTAAPVASAASIGVGITSSLNTIPTWVGDQDGWGASVTNTGSVTEQMRVSISAASTTLKVIPGVSLTPITFTLAPGASCLVGLRWSITAEMAASPKTFGSTVVVTAGAAGTTSLTGTGVITQAAVGAPARLTADPSAGRYGNGMLSKAQVLCGTGETFTPPAPNTFAVNDWGVPIWATRHYLQANLTGVNSKPMVLTRVGGVYNGKTFGDADLADPKPAWLGTRTFGNEGTRGWIIPASGRCVIPDAVAGMGLTPANNLGWTVRRYATQLFDIAVPLGSTGGVVHGRYADGLTVYDLRQGVAYADYAVTATAPLCAPAN